MAPVMNGEERLPFLYNLTHDSTAYSDRIRKLLIGDASALMHLMAANFNFLANTELRNRVHRTPSLQDRLILSLLEHCLPVVHAEVTSNLEMHVRCGEHNF